jgi:hypothetical protein
MSAIAVGINPAPTASTKCLRPQTPSTTPRSSGRRPAVSQPPLSSSIEAPIPTLFAMLFAVPSGRIASGIPRCASRRAAWADCAVASRRDNDVGALLEQSLHIGLLFDDANQLVATVLNSVANFVERHAVARIPVVEERYFHAGSNSRIAPILQSAHGLPNAGVLCASSSRTTTIGCSPFF